MSGKGRFGNDARKILDLLIYRCTEQQYWNEQKAYRDQLIRNSGYDPSSKAQYIIDLKRDLGQHLFETRGGVWTLSEAVGVISIFFTPSLIGAFLYFVNARIVKNMRNKRVFFRGKLFDFNVWLEDNNDTIYQTLQRSLKDSIAEAKILRGRVIDLGPLDSLGPHINWVGLFRPRDEATAENPAELPHHSGTSRQGYIGSRRDRGAQASGRRPQNGRNNPANRPGPH